MQDFFLLLTVCSHEQIEREFWLSLNRIISWFSVLSNHGCSDLKSHFDLYEVIEDDEKLSKLRLTLSASKDEYVESLFPIGARLHRHENAESLGVSFNWVGNWKFKCSLGPETRNFRGYSSFLPRSVNDDSIFWVTAEICAEDFCSSSDVIENTDFVQQIKRQWLCWLGHVIRMHESAPALKIFEAVTPHGSRRRQDLHLIATGFPPISVGCFWYSLISNLELKPIKNTFLREMDLWNMSMSWGLNFITSILCYDKSILILFHKMVFVTALTNQHSLARVVICKCDYNPKYFYNINI